MDNTKTKWIRIITGVLFVLFGLVKFVSPGMQEAAFEPYPGFLMPLIGILEIAGGAALLANQMVRWAALGLGVIMVGAIVTHFIIGISPQVVLPIVLLVLSGLICTKSGASENVTNKAA